MIRYELMKTRIDNRGKKIMAVASVALAIGGGRELTSTIIEPPVIRTSNNGVLISDSWAQQLVKAIIGPVDAVSAASECTECIDPTPVPTARPAATPKPATPKPVITTKPTTTTTTARPTAVPTMSTMPTARPVGSPSASPTAEPSPSPVVLGVSSTGQPQKSWWQNAFVAPIVVGLVGAFMMIGGLIRVWRQSRA